MGDLGDIIKPSVMETRSNRIIWGQACAKSKSELISRTFL
jgi:hypothetical protein